MTPPAPLEQCGRPGVENWLGPASVAPLLLWFMHGLRAGRQGEAAPAPTER